MDAISWHYFKCQQQTRYSLGRWWWRGVFRWTCGGNTAARKNNGPKLRGTISIIINVIHFVLFWKHDKDYELWIFWTVLRIVRHKSKQGWAAGKSVTVGYICIADTFCVCVFLYNWLRVSFWDVLSLWICLNLANYLQLQTQYCKRCLLVL